MAGGGELGLVLGGGGGGFCSGAPPGCELGEVAAGAACWSDGGVLGLDDSLDGELVEVSFGLLDGCEHAPRESASATAHSNGKLRFIRVTSQKDSSVGGAVSQAPFHTDRLSWGESRRGACYLLAVGRFFFLAGSLARDLPKDPRYILPRRDL